MVSPAFARRGLRPRRRAATGVAVLVTAGICAVSCLRSGLDARAWLGLSPSSGSDAPIDAESTSSGRRQVLSGGTVAAASIVAAGAWVAAPEDALAFRADRIYNAKANVVPSIRQAYQKIEGFRDDIFVKVQVSTGEIFSFPSRPADWYDGRDGQFKGNIFLAPDGAGCTPYDAEAAKGAIVLVARGKCKFAQKMKIAKDAGAKAVIVYDVKTSRMEKFDDGVGGGLAARRSLGASPNTGGVAIAEGVKGVTIMAVDPKSADPKPDIGAVMIDLDNGTAVTNVIKNGGTAKVLGTDRFEFKEGIDEFIKNKELKKMMNQMEIYSNVQRMAKDDMSDPILTVLGKDRKLFKKAVEDKDYAAIRNTFAAWNGHLDPLGKWELTELE